MPKPVQWGFLATGSIAHSFARDLALHGFSLRAVGSRSMDAASAFAAEFGLPAAYGSYEELVADPEVDVVYVSTPHPFHAEHAMLALNAGKHVLVEKPFSLNARQAQEMVDLAESRGLLILEAMWTRFLPQVERITQVIAEGTLGDVQAFIADHTQSLPADPEHRINSLALGGGALLDLGVYPISFASLLFGPPSSVVASGVLGPTGADVHAAVTLHYEGGRTASTFTASNIAGPNRASIVGTKARIELDPVWHTPTRFRVIDASGTVIETFESSVEGRGMHLQALEVERVLREGRRASEVLSPAESVSIMHTLDEVRRQIGVSYPGE